MSCPAACAGRRNQGHEPTGRLGRTARGYGRARRRSKGCTVRHFDLVIIGTGSGNSILDERFDDWNVAIVEKGVFGGTCLNVGCIPTKMFVHTANVAGAPAAGTKLGVDA